MTEVLNEAKLTKNFFFGCMIMTRVHVVMDRTSDNYFKTFFLLLDLAGVLVLRK